MMPSHNDIRYIEATVASIKNQTYANWELIFVDDGSTDQTLEIIRKLGEGDSRIRIFSIPYSGRGRARNVCIENVKGEFVAVCDSDDISLPNRFEKQLHFLMEHPEIGVVGSWWIPFATEKPEKDSPIRVFPTEPDQLKHAFERGKMRLHNATAMIRSNLFEKFGKYNIELRRAQDYEFFSRLNREGVLFSTLPEALLYYRQEAEIPSLKYFNENGMFMAYADRILDGKKEKFDEFSKSLVGKTWCFYYNLKFFYFYIKIFILNALGR